MRALIAALLLLCLLSYDLQNACAQVDRGEEVPIVTRTHALVNATVVRAPGRVLEQATVVIRDGLILSVGQNVVVPFDAERIDADSLTVYAGFIDGLSHAGLPAPKEEPDRERPENPAFPPDDEAGIQPDRDAQSMLDPDDKSLQDLRNAGFTTAHVVPRGRMLTGSGAIILLAGESANELVVKRDVSLFAQFQPARGMYPGTDMAIIAKWRQLHREAARRQRVERLYAEDPTGLARPSYDPVHYALFPVLDGEKPVYFNADDVLDLHRVLALQAELGFRVVITGLEGSFDAIDKLKAANHPLMLGLDLPTAAEKKPESGSPDSTQAAPGDAAAELPEAAASDYDPMLRTRSFEDVEAEKKNLEARLELERAKHYSSAATLHGAGLTFGLSSLNAKPSEALSNVRRMVEHGLPEDAALAALTTNPADILGLSASMGTVDPGKMGNLVVTTGPIFDEDTKIRYVFVDGAKFEIKARPPSSSDSVGTVNPAGTWSITIYSPDGDVQGAIVIGGSDGNWTGTLTNDMMVGAADLEDIEVVGSSLSFLVHVDAVGEVTASFHIADDELDGTVTAAGLGTFTVDGSRTSGPES